MLLNLYCYYCYCCFSSEKTAAEARKIEEIRNELTKLDNDVAVDVAILRKQIDDACIHFANIEYVFNIFVCIHIYVDIFMLYPCIVFHIRKQYTKIESQFLKMKMDLHNAAERKELLTEHLYTVIAHNEDRKAQKLGELMSRVGLNTNGGDCQEEYQSPVCPVNAKSFP